MGFAPTNIQTYRLDPLAFESTTRRQIFKRLVWVIPLVLIPVTIQLGVMVNVQKAALDSTYLDSFHCRIAGIRNAPGDSLATQEWTTLLGFL